MPCGRRVPRRHPMNESLFYKIIHGHADAGRVAHRIIEFKGDSY